MEIVRENSDDQQQQNDAENEETSDAEQNEDDFTYEDEEATKKRSPLWQHFSVVIDQYGKRFAKCNHCAKLRKYLISGKSNGGTGNMGRHLRNKHPSIVLVETLNEEGPFVFSQQKFRKALMKWVVICDQPSTAAGEPAFIELVDSLDPDAHIISDKTIKADELAEYLLKFDELKKSLVRFRERYP
ncbi:zinc finger BED domain-containing protein RICESLEEPER 4-like [Bradysia coprophila]|uniref:zinc finger BED domain-containing protein RICESLEEPER 4-like n=1 Tax=Bradysia coprophila TaxID=38358 RepID=UPI00187D8C32|nr:zinc finger BED domain-containing protein RICESLEEPER 4-like [Bradysia coprophila]